VVGLDEMFKESDDKFCIFADDADIFRRFNGDGLVVVAPLVETYRYLSVNIVADGHLALAPVAFAFRFARNKLVHD
jgi:hypothetical protein